MKFKQKCQIDTSQAGALLYHEGGTEYRFPIYEEEGEVVFVAWPTRQRIFLHLLKGGWKRVPTRFPTSDRERITAQVVGHFRRAGKRIRVMTRTAEDEPGLQFHPELFECKGRATECLDSAGVAWMSDYGSIDLLHEEFGLEVCGIHEEASVEPVAEALRAEFQQWHYCSVCHKDYGREPGWKFAIHMFPRRCGEGRCAETD